MIFCTTSTAIQRIYWNKCIHIRNPNRYNQRFTFLACASTRTHIHPHPYTHTYLQPHINEILTAFCLHFVAFSIFACILSHFRFSISFHLLNCLMNVVINFKKPLFAEQYFPWIKYIFNIYLFIIIIIIIIIIALS